MLGMSEPNQAGIFDGNLETCYHFPVQIFRSADGAEF